MLAQLQYDSIDDLSYSFISWSLRNSMPQFMPFVYRNSFYVLKDCAAGAGAEAVNAALGKAISGAAGASISSEFLTEREKPLFFKCFRNIDYECGVSSMFFSLRNLRTAAAQCREALATGRSSLWNSPEMVALRSGGASEMSQSAAANDGIFYRYDDVAFVHILSQLRRVMPADALESPYFRMLSKYDSEHDTDLCAVMAQYIVCGCSVTRTAAATYMHRNTILNKVKKAAAVTGDPLEDFTAQVLFMMSYVNSIA